jgi:D-alanyl-D-alanine carboxypeptidase/D-alanyl-D-alanine-endopeptidase (penicillin-binding protein 4)
MGFVVSPGQGVGDKAHLALEPYSLETSQIVGQVKTTAGRSSRVSVTRVKRGQTDVFAASGSIGQLSDPVRVYRSVSDPDSYAASVLKAFLEKDGVVVRRGSRVEKEFKASHGRAVATVEGFPLSWQLLGLFKVSNNFIGDMLTLQLDSDLQPRRSATLRGGAERLETYMKEVVVGAAKPLSSDTKGLVLKSGSGLTHENRLSARDVVALLQRMYANTREFPAFLSALPVPGAEGTVRNRFQSRNTRHLQDRLRAKTGTLSEPRDAIGLAGYSRLKNGDWVAFCTIVNGTEKNPSVGIETARRTIDEDLAELLPPEL